MKEQILTVAVEGERLVISIGIETLAWAAEHNPLTESYGDDGEFRNYKVTDPGIFAAEVVNALHREDEEGTTPVHTLFDHAFLTAIESGCEGASEEPEVIGDDPLPSPTEGEGK